MSESVGEWEQVPDSVWELTVERAALLTPLAETSHCTVEQIDEVARHLKISRTMVYRLLARFRAFPQTSSLLPEKPGRKRGTKELSPAQERIIDVQIREFYLSKRRPSMAALHRAIASDCFQSKIPSPSYKAVKARVELIAVRDALQAREGARAAGSKFQPIAGSLVADHPLEIVQIDHTLVDVIVVDDLHRKPIGRPWLSLAIDIATRTVPGFFLSLQSPSALSVAMTISRAVLPKDEYLAALQVQADWPVCGIPETLHLDNGKEFHARALLRGCGQYGIRIVHRPPCRPHFGGHIERLIGTLMGEIHLLPGTTFSSTAARGDYNSTRHAAMTLRELEAWLAWQIAGVYHLRMHSSLHHAPLEAWKEGVALANKPLRQPASPKRFYIDFLPYKKRAVGRDGIRMFNVLYWHGALHSYIRDGKRYVVKYDPNDISRVYLLERGNSYLEVPYRDLSHRPASVKEIQNGARLCRVAEKNTVDEQRLFQAVEKQREVMEAAKKKTMKARRQIQQTAQPKFARTSSVGPPLRPSEPEEPADPFPFEIWHE
jgi:putative transposase